MIKILGLHKRQEEIKDAILTSNAKFHTLKASRQSGKGYLIYKLATALALSKPNINIGIVAPIYSQSKIIYDRILTIKNIDKYINSNSSNPPIIRFNNGSKIEFRSADNTDGIRGSTYHYVFVDEAAFISDDVFTTVIRPTTAAVIGSKIIFTSTPRGKHNIFATHYILGEQGNDNYKSYSMNYVDNPVYDLNEVEDAKKMLPELIFRQEYEAEFIDDSGSVFSNIDNVCVLNEYSKGNRLYAGLDLGRADDFTVLHILNHLGETVFNYSINNDTWSNILDKVIEILYKYNPLVMIETNGIGDVLYESVSNKYSNCIPFTTTNSSKQSIVEGLRLDMENKSIKLPTKDLYSKLYNEFSVFEFNYSLSSRNVKYGARKGFHDDEIMALALANKCRVDNKVGFNAIIPEIETNYKY